MDQTSDALHSPVAFLRAMLGANLPDAPDLRAYESDCQRAPLAEIAALAPDVAAVRRGYAAGVVWRGFVQETALPSYLLAYIAAFYDPRLADLYAATLATTQLVDKYAPEPPRAHLLTLLKARDGSTPQGARGFDGAVSAATEGDGWRLSGRVDNVRIAQADLAVVAAQVEGASVPALFLVSRLRADGSSNLEAEDGGMTLTVSEGYLLGATDDGPALTDEFEGLTAAMGCLSVVALAQRLLSDAGSFDPAWLTQHREAFALAWTAVTLLNDTWREMPAYPSDTGRLFRLVVRLACLRAGTLAEELTRALDQAGAPGEAWLNRDGELAERAAHVWSALKDAETPRLLADLIGPYTEGAAPVVSLTARPNLASVLAAATSEEGGLAAAMSRLLALTQTAADTMARTAATALARRMEAARGIAGEP